MVKAIANELSRQLTNHFKVVHEAGDTKVRIVKDKDNPDIPVQLFRDSANVEPKLRPGRTINYANVPSPAFAGLSKDSWVAPQNGGSNGSLMSGDTDTGVMSTMHVEAPLSRSAKKEAKRNWMLLLLDGNLLSIFMTLLTVWALFGDDIKIATMPPAADIPCAIVAVVVFVVFGLELLLRCWAEEGYFMSFFFCLDLIATASLVFDFVVLFQALDDDGGGDGASVARASKAARAGTRVGRLLRLIRVVRVVKLIAMMGKQRKKRERKKTRARASMVAARGSKENMRVQEEGDTMLDDHPPSAIGKKMNDLIAQKVIIGVLCTLVFLQLLDTPVVDTGVEEEITMIFKCLEVSKETAQCEPLVQQMYDRNSNSLLHLQLADHAHGAQYNEAPSCTHTEVGPLRSCLLSHHNLRSISVEQPMVDGQPQAAYSAFVSGEADDYVIAVTGMLTTLFVAILLGMGGFVLGRDLNRLVIKPIENMVDNVHRLAEDPTNTETAVQKTKYETDALCVALQKIGNLLYVGLGGAGLKLIKDNLSDDSSGNLNLNQLKGTRMSCAFGFCDIRQFTDTVECLQDRVMLFTNSVGKIIHTACFNNNGEPNKNIGDAFLIVWRPHGGQDTWTKCVDGALVSFRRCLREVASSAQLQEIINVDEIKSKFPPGHKTRLGYGLHFGWAIEGPIGSSVKIDCSYLSPEVKISDRLEAATKIYSVNILMTEDFFNMLSPHMQEGIRKIDSITLKGGSKPYVIYGDDRSNLFLKMKESVVTAHGAAGAYQKWSEVYHKGINAFIEGDWPTASGHLRKALESVPGDVPTRMLLEEISARGVSQEKASKAEQLLAPEDWPGYHDSEV